LVTHYGKLKTKLKTELLIHFQINSSQTTSILIIMSSFALNQVTDSHDIWDTDADRLWDSIGNEVVITAGSRIFLDAHYAIVDYPNNPSAYPNVQFKLEETVKGSGDT
jgi:hypothetical protein